MKLIIGLGNFGDRYIKNRHNVGFMAVDALFLKFQSENIKFENSKKLKSLLAKHQLLILAKPQTYMNYSGNSVSKIVKQYKIKIPDIWVIHDDLDLPLGQYKIQFGTGPKIHKGILSIEEKLKDKNFWRVRIGVDNRQKEFRIPGDRYVLENFKEDELIIIEKVIESIKQELENKINI